MEAPLRRFAVVTCTWLSLLAAICANAQVRGTGRLQGNVVDKGSGKPVAGATVTITTPGSGTKPIITKTDGRGHWAALGMTSGQWNIDVSAPGYLTSRGSASVSEVASAPPINLQLEPEVKQEAAPAEVAPAGPTVPKEAIDAIKEGQELLRIKAGDVTPGTTHTAAADEVKENAKRASADFERALPMIPDDKPELRDVRNQVLGILAQAYYKAGDLKDAIATLEKLDTLDPATATPDAAHATRDVLLANLYLENAQLEQGKALLEKLPPTAITDPTAYINIGILFLNKKDPSTATTYFTKAIQMNGKQAESYYYRGLAEMQLNKYAAAKADFQQVVALSPDSSEARDAKQMLASLK
jgi:predicted negative regulator of RcsB-dependent stress response